MKRINKLDTHLQRTGYGWSALLLALPFVGMGVFLTLGGLGVIDIADKANAPLWVIAGIGIAFAVAGLLLVAYSATGLLHRRRARQLRGRHAYQPWFKDYPWDPSGIRDLAHLRWVSSLVGAILIGAFMVPFNWWAFLSDEGPMMVKIITGLFDFVLLLVFLSLLYRLAQYFKYGRSELGFAHFPFGPGEPLRVTLYTGYGGQLEATLRFVEERFEQRGSDNSTTHSVYEHFSEQRTFSPPARGTGIPIEFELPDNREWVNQLTADPEVRYWELLLEGKTPGVNFRTTFPLPVYDRPASQAITTPAPARRTRVARWRIPYSFEIGMPVAIFALLWLAWRLAPEPMHRGIEAVQDVRDHLQAKWSFIPVDGIGASGLAARTGPDGRVWVLTKYSLDRFVGETRETLLDTARYKKLFNPDVNALSSLLVTGEDEAWVGSWYGELFHYRAGTWRQLTLRGEYLDHRIHGLARLDNRLYLATSRGIWTWEPDEDRLRQIDNAPAGRTEAIAVNAAGVMCAGMRDGLWCLSEGQWALRWKSPEASYKAIYTLTPQPDGGWLVGTHDGIYTLAADFALTSHELPGKWVTRILPHGDRLWVTTWKSGILRRDRNGWQARETDSLSDIAIDARGDVWLASYGKGLYRASTDTMDRLLR